MNILMVVLLVAALVAFLVGAVIAHRAGRWAGATFICLGLALLTVVQLVGALALR